MTLWRNPAVAWVCRPGPSRVSDRDVSEAYQLPDSLPISVHWAHIFFFFDQYMCPMKPPIDRCNVRELREGGEPLFLEIQLLLRPLKTWL